MPEIRIFTVDDEPSILQVLDGMLAEKYTVTGFTDGRKALEAILAGPPQIVITDVYLNDMNGIDILKEVKAALPDVQFIVMSGRTTTTVAIEAIQEGAVDYINKPFELEEITKAVNKALKYGNLTTNTGFQKVMHTSIHSKHRERLVGKNPLMLEIYKTIGRVADTKSNVLITGESGTGKELVARMIAQMSGTNEDRFTTLNCSAIPETLFESELFGYEKGSFTGAEARRIGKVEAANGGILFLDEIDTMPLLMQSKILRLIQQKEFQRVGGVETLRANVRIVAACKADIMEQVKQGTFKEDLYYRLSVIKIDIPPLRERPDDIIELFNYFLTEMNNRHGKRICDIAAGLLEKVVAYPWPGNIRELENAVERAVLLAGKGLLAEEHFPFLAENDRRPVLDMDGSDVEGLLHAAVERIAPAEFRNRDGRLYNELVGTFEKNLFARVLANVDGNQVRAAKALGLSRNTLRDRMKKFGLGNGG